MRSVSGTGLLLTALDDASELRAVRGKLPPRFSDVTDDSRKVTKGALFIAVPGSAADGHDYLEAAAAAGATAAIVQDASRTSLPVFVVRNTRRAAAVAASAFYGNPGSRLEIVGVTGTNGKTTTTGMLRHLLDERDARAASIGTLGVLIGSRGEGVSGGAGLTTPGPVELQRVLRTLVDAGVRRVAMEVSSHSLDQERIEGLQVASAIFTNVSRDHLDYHGTMEAYIAAKARLMDFVVPGGVAVINADDDAWSVLTTPERLHSRSLRVVRFGQRSPHLDVTAADVRLTPRGSEWTLVAGGERVAARLPLLGDFNVMNALGAAAGAWSLGQSAARIAERLATLPQVAGRLERILDHPVVLRDYAHTPDALSRALAAVRGFVQGRLIVVFGCGGDRDRGKRPQMGAIAERGADHVILTSDNPRTEDPERILDDIETGMTQRRHERIEDRRRAIARALAIVAPDDVILLAGKGHETYQIRGTTYLPFDEREIVRELANGAAA